MPDRVLLAAPDPVAVGRCTILALAPSCAIGLSVSQLGIPIIARQCDLRVVIGREPQLGPGLVDQLPHATGQPDGVGKIARASFLIGRTVAISTHAMKGEL